MTTGLDDPPVPPWWILHVDMDQFIAAVEIRARPELRGRPVVVGGDGDPSRPRQVVGTASYEARAYGIRSGMPLARARARCPDAVFLATDHAAYDAASAQVMTTLRSFGHPVEVWGWDEAVLGARTDDPEALAQAVRRRLVEQTELTCAVGIGETKERAKMATTLAKAHSDRVFRLWAQNWFEHLGAEPVTALWGVGARTGARLRQHGLVTVADLARADPEALAGWFGPTIGPRLGVLARGGTSRTIHAEPWVPRSRSRQVTYPQDLTDAALIEQYVVAMAREVADEAFAEGRRATHVGVTVRTASFYTRTRTGKLPEVTTDPELVAEGARRVLGRFSIERPVRLLGVRVDLAAVEPPAAAARPD